MGTLTIYRTYFLEDDIVDGDFPRDDTTTDVTECSFCGLSVTGDGTRHGFDAPRKAAIT
jgi:hypothetical protein